MILVDTSVWVDFFRGARRARRLATLLEANEVLLHSSVLGELALGNLGSKPQNVLADLRRLALAPRVPDDEVLEFVTSRNLSGRGIGWVDAHLLASAMVEGCEFWTFDRALASMGSQLGLAAPFSSNR